MMTPWSDFNRTFGLLDQMRRRMERVFDDYEETGFSGVRVLPRAALYDAGDELILEAEIPGIHKDGIDLSINQDVLTLKGERKTTIPEGYTAHRRERGDLSFARSFTLPIRVDLEKTAATLNDGLLTVRMHKAPESQPRRINVKG